MKLWEITGELNRAIELYNEVESDEDLKSLEAKLNDLSLSFKDKAIAVARHILNVESDEVAISAEIDRLTKLKSRATSAAEWFHGYLFRSMLAVNEKEIDGVTVKLKIKKNPPAVIITDETKIPEKYKRIIPEKKEPDKTAIKQAWKDGIGVEGTKVEQAERLEIK